MTKFMKLRNVGNVNVTARNMKRSDKYHKSGQGWTNLKTESVNGLELRSDLSSN